LPELFTTGERRAIIREILKEGDVLEEGGRVLTAGDEQSARNLLQQTSGLE
jgi:hypothetical protein